MSRGKFLQFSGGMAPDSLATVTKCALCATQAGPTL